MALLIDGYNLLHAIGLLGPGLGPGGLERSRAALVAHLAASLPPEELAQTTVVFDAAGAPADLPSVLKSGGLTICFAIGYEDADTRIEELIRTEPNPRRLLVVSSDHRIQRAARRRKATAVDSQTWYDELVRQRQQGREPAPQGHAAPAKPEGPVPEDEVAYWLGQFGDEPIAEVPAQGRASEEGPGEGRWAKSPPGADPHGGKLTPEEAAEIDDPFPPGYGEDLLENERDEERHERFPPGHGEDRGRT